jgi:hypothetical protein
MATDLLLPSGLAPSNLHLRPTVKASFVTSDLYDICQRVKEISPRIHVFELTDDATGDRGWSIMEHCDDGVERLIFRVGPGHPIDALDGRVLERLRYILSVPLSERFAALEADEIKTEAQRQDDELEELYEKFGGEMRHELARCGFTGPLPASYRPMNATARRHRNARAG